MKYDVSRVGGRRAGFRCGAFHRCPSPGRSSPGKTATVRAVHPTFVDGDSAGQEAYPKQVSLSGYVRTPTIADDRIVFACEDDLWIVGVQGGIARRLTTMAGECSLPRLSPDGTRLAF